MISHLFWWTWFCVLTVTTIAAYWVMDGPTTAWWRGAVYVLAPATGVLAGLLLLQEFSPKSAQGRALIALTLGIGCWFIGETLWTYYDLIANVDPYPSTADLFYLIAYLALGAGLLMEAQFLRGQAHQKLPAAQSVLFAVIAVLLLVIAGYFGVYLAIKPDYTLLENMVAISYGVADVGLVVMGLIIAIVTWELRGGKFATPWWWLLIGLTCTFVADIAFAVFTPEYEAGEGLIVPILDTLWIFSYLAIAYGFGRLTWMIQTIQYSIRLAAQRKTEFTPTTPAKASVPKRTKQR